MTSVGHQVLLPGVNMKEHSILPEMGFCLCQNLGHHPVHQDEVHSKNESAPSQLKDLPWIAAHPEAAQGDVPAIMV